MLKNNYQPFLVLWNMSIIYEKINKLDSLLKIIDNPLINNEVDYYDLLIHKGNIFYLKKDYKKSIIYLDEVLNFKNDNSWAYFLKCRKNEI